MSFTFESYQSLLLPLVAFGAYIGWKRGFWIEVGYTLGMALVLLATVIFPEQFMDLVSQLIVLIPRIFRVMVGGDFSLPTSTDLFGTPDSGRFLLTRMALFALLTFLVYNTRYGWAYEGGKARGVKTTAGRLMGVAFGGSTLFFWFLALNNFLDSFRLLRDDPTIPPEGLTISVPTFQNPEVLLGLVPTMLVVILLVLGVLAVLRLPNIWKG
ncbi:hypothetical protein F8S13_16010 [Chloroflexia bacterium SDU3-3]|nr:hypothetical protein F8S13_16010 [Chloroflexia bacterium SDU3-3]